MKTQLTVKDALDQGYKYYFYDSDGWQSMKEIKDMEMDFSKDDISLAEKEPYNPTGLNSKDIADLLADRIQDQHNSETSCDTNDIYNTIKELDFSVAEMIIDEALSKINYYCSSGIKLIP